MNNVLHKSDLSEYFDPNPPRFILIGKAYGEKSFNNKLILSDNDTLYSIITILNNIGTIFIKEKKIDSAKELLEEILLLCKTNFQEENQVFLEAMNNLGEILLEQQLYEEAVKCYQKCLKIYNKLYFSKNQQYYRYLFNLAEALRASKNLVESKDLFEELLLDLKQEKTSIYIEEGLLFNNYALLLFELGQYNESKKYFFKALDFYSEYLPKNHPILGEIMDNLMNIAQQAGAADA